MFQKTMRCSGAIRFRVRPRQLMIRPWRQFSSTMRQSDVYSGQTSTQVRTEEQRKADKLNHEGMLRLADRLLALEALEPGHARDCRIALNYWTSPLQSQLRDHEDAPQVAFKLFEALMRERRSLVVQEVVKTDDNPMGGLVYLVEHLLFGFQDIMLKVEKASVGHRDGLMTALLQASQVIQTMQDLQSNPAYPEIETDALTCSLAALNLWSKRVWFLTRFGADAMTAEEVENIFGGCGSVSQCMTAMKKLADDTFKLENVPLIKLYSMLISTWVHSELPQSLDVALDLLKKIEEEESIDQLSVTPYGSVLFLCSKQGTEESASIALRLWRHLRAPDSKAEPDVGTLGALLLALINGNELDDAMTVLDEMERDQGVKTLKPNTHCYNIVIGGLVESNRTDAARLAESLLQRMAALNETGMNPSAAPDEISYSTLLELVANQGGSVEAESILIRCKNEMGLEPDTQMYNIVLDSYSRQNSANSRDRQKSKGLSEADRAVSLLRTMEANPKTLPNLISYNCVLNVFSKSGVSFERTHFLFQEMKDKAASGDESVKPDIITYNTVLGAAARDRSHNGLLVVDALFEEMRLNNVLHDRITFNTLMDSIIKGGHSGAAELAESIIEKMEVDFAENKGGVRPDASSYNTVLNGYANANSLEAAQHAEEVLTKMIELSMKEGREDCKPDFVSYASVLNAYARSRIPDAGFKAELLLQDMESYSITPNIVCYNSAINCWAKSKHMDAPQRAESLLDRMLQHVQPNSVSFSSVMNCWAQSSLEGAAEHAHAILTRMEHLAKAGDKGMTPNAYSYSTVISAWGKVGRSDKAMEVLNRVKNPNFACYNAAMNAVAKSRSLNKAEEAASVLERMKLDFQRTGRRDAAPTAISYSSVLNACAYTINNDPQERSKAFKIARMTFKDMLENVEPTPHCYDNFLTACLRLLPHDQRRDAIIAALHQDCQQRGLLTDRVQKGFAAAMSNLATQQEKVG